MYTKLSFFERIRSLLLKAKPCMKQCKIKNEIEGEIVVVVGRGENQENEIGNPTCPRVHKGGNNNSSNVHQLIRGRDNESRNWMVLQRAVKKLHFGTWEEKEEGAKEITRLMKEDMKRRKLMVELGVIQPLVDMVASKVVERQRIAIQALVQLSNGSFTNKAMMMEAGLLRNLPSKIDSLDQSTKQEYALLLFSLSSISSNKYPLKSSKMITFVLNILDSNAKIETILLCLGTLHNLALVIENSGDLISCNSFDILLRFCSTSEASEKALATLGNLAVTLMGRKALENHPTVPENFIEILSREDNTKCQELASYILMILAHKSCEQREKMAKAKIVPVLLEVALLGSPLAQKRALKLLEWFKDERQGKMGPHSGPQYCRIAITNPPSNDAEAKEGKQMMTNIVKQSLYKNMERITSRAKNGTSATSASFKELVVSSSSKSLPY